jgi:preprotein translocase subunit SecY
MRKFLQLFRIPDLRKSILTVLGLLIAFRALAAIPIPGVDPSRLNQLFTSNQLLGFLNLFSGGGLTNLSIAMLGVSPYITATIIMQLATMLSPRFKEMYYEEGARGQERFNQYARVLTVPLALLQGYGFLNLLASQQVIARPDGWGMAMNLIAITAGSMIALWLGELISEQKLGNGISLIILAGIVSSIPGRIRTALLSYTASLLPTYLGFFVILLLVILGVVYLNEGERKVPVAYARRVRGQKLYGGVQSYLPLKVNQAGMIPLIFAVSVLLFPQFIAQAISVVSVSWSLKLNGWINAFLANQLIYGIFYFALVFAFTYFYTSITFNADEVAKNLQRSGGFIPGIRPGEGTAAFFKSLIGKITFFGAVFLGLVAVIPIIVQAVTGISGLTVSGTALLIVVAVALETMRQVNGQLSVREYDTIR